MTGESIKDVFTCAHTLYTEAEQHAAAQRLMAAVDTELAEEAAAPDIAQMVNRFLCWPLPKTFSPDCGVSFAPQFHSWPTGTNLLNVVEARAMFEYVTAAPSLQQPKEGAAS